MPLYGSNKKNFAVWKTAKVNGRNKRGLGNPKGQGSTITVEVFGTSMVFTRKYPFGQSPFHPRCFQKTTACRLWQNEKEGRYAW